VVGSRAGLAGLSDPATRVRPGSDPAPGAEPVTPDLRTEMWRDCGLIREATGLQKLQDAPHLLVRLIAGSALAREESRGGHFRSDFPLEDVAFAAHTVIRPGREPVFERLA